MEEYLDSRDLEEELEISKDKDRIKEIKKLKEEVNSEEWDFGINFIREDEFRNFAINEIENLGYMKENNPMFNYIDFEKWICDYEVNYSSVKFDNYDYFYRA